MLSLEVSYAVDPNSFKVYFIIDGHVYKQYAYLIPQNPTHAIFFKFKKDALKAFCKECSIFSPKTVTKAFADYDFDMVEIYNKKYNLRGSGRKKGKKIGHIKEPTVLFARRVSPKEKLKLEKYLLKLRQKEVDTVD